MVYTYDDDGGNELKKPEIEVTVSLSGVQKDYTLAWGDGHLRAGQPRLLSYSPRSSASCSTSVA